MTNREISLLGFFGLLNAAAGAIVAWYAPNDWRGATLVIPFGLAHGIIIARLLGLGERPKSTIEYYAEDGMNDEEASAIKAAWQECETDDAAIAFSRGWQAARSWDGGAPSSLPAALRSIKGCWWTSASYVCGHPATSAVHSRCFFKTCSHNELGCHDFVEGKR